MIYHWSTSKTCCLLSALPSSNIYWLLGCLFYMLHLTCCLAWYIDVWNVLHPIQLHHVIKQKTCHWDSLFTCSALTHLCRLGQWPNNIVRMFHVTGGVRLFDGRMCAFGQFVSLLTCDRDEANVCELVHWRSRRCRRRSCTRTVTHQWRAALKFIFKILLSITSCKLWSGCF